MRGNEEIYEKIVRRDPACLLSSVWADWLCMFLPSRLRDCFFRTLRRRGAYTLPNIRTFIHASSPALSTQLGRRPLSILVGFGTRWIEQSLDRGTRSQQRRDKRTRTRLMTSSNTFIAAQKKFDGLAGHLHRWLEAWSLMWHWYHSMFDHPCTHLRTSLLAFVVLLIRCN